MKRLILIFALISVFLALPVFAQTPAPKSFVAAGMGYFSMGHPNIQGWGAAGIPIPNTERLISYTDFDVAVVKEGGQLSVAGHQIQYTMRTGVAYRIASSSGWSLFGLAAPGFAATGTSFVGAFQYGGFVHKSIGRGWGAMVALTNERYNNQSDFAPRLGITKQF
jgi:hypothetical protein